MFFRRLAILLLAAAFALSAAPARAEYSFLADTIQEVYNDAGRIPLSQANKIIHSTDGYIWIASYDGLFRYDGKQAKLFTVDDGFPSRSVMTIFQDSQGRLWIGTNNAGLVRYDSAAGFTVLGTGQGLPSNSVRAIAEDKQGNIYAATPLGLVTVLPDLKISQVRLPKRGPLFIINMFAAQNGEIWCVQNSGGVLVLAGGGLARQYPPRHFGQAIVTSAFQASDGLIYLGTADKRVILLHPDDSYKIIGTETQRHINGFYEDRLSRVWVCSDSGMGFFEQGKFYTVRGALIDRSIQNMTEDFEGNLWFASSRVGVLQVLRSSFKNVSLAASLPPLVVNAVERYQGRLYIGTDTGLVILDDRGRAASNKLTRQLAGARVRALSADADGNLWISTFSSQGLLRYRGDGSILSFNRASHGLLSDKVRCALPGRGRVLVGTAEGLSILQNNRVVKNYAKADGLTNPVVMNIYESPEGAIYLGSDGGGIYKIENGQITNYSEADGLGSGIIMRLRHDPALRGLWVSTENGLSFWDESGIRPIAKLGQFGVNIFDIQLKGEDEIWLLGSGGVHMASRKSLLDESAPLRLETLQRRDGLVHTITANAWNYRTPDQEPGGNELYICTNQGVLSIDMDEVAKRGTAPRLLVSSVMIDEREIRSPREVVVPADAARLTVNFSLISYTYSSGNSVQAFLEGFDREPVELTTSDALSVSYTNLPGGRYTLNIHGRNRDGLKSQTVSLPIFKERRLMERPLVRLAVVLLLLGLGVLGARWYTRHKTRAILKRQAEYREITDQAVRAIADTIDAKDHYTSGHSGRVAEYSLEIARRLGLSEKEREDLYYAALLHDIGKVGIGDSILNKDGLLTPEEYEKVKNHVRLGGDILKSISVIKDIAVGARYHHERWDGSGYCEGLKGEEIPLFARIICVADAYDAMSTTRPYRAELSREYILGELRRGCGTQFDGAIVPVMMEIISELEKPESGHDITGQ